MVNPKPYSNGVNPKPKPTLGKPNPNSQQVCFHQNDHLPDNTHPKDSTQAMVLIEFLCFTFNSSSSRCSIGQFNVCLFVSLITVTLKTKTEQDASAQGAGVLVLTDLGSAESNGFDS